MAGIPQIKQLPSGNYNAMVYIGKDANGKRKYKSLTASTKREVKLMIAEFLSERDTERLRADDKTVGDAMKAYIAAKDAVLSPSTIRGYDSIARTHLRELQKMRISDLTAENLQFAINEEAKSCSSKTVRNINGFLCSALQLADPQFRYNVTLPQKVKPDITIPSNEGMTRLFCAVRGESFEIPLYLAAMCGMRRSEIAALKWEDVDLVKGTLTIRATIVIDKDGNCNYREMTKTSSSKRTIVIFKPALDLLRAAPKDREFVIPQRHPSYYTKAFTALLEKENMPHFRFHDLRHYTVSTMLMLNIPKKYIADYVGHSTEHMIDTVYGHIMTDKKHDFMNAANTYFIGLSAQMQDETQNDN